MKIEKLYNYLNSGFDEIKTSIDPIEIELAMTILEYINSVYLVNLNLLREKEINFNVYRVILPLSNQIVLIYKSALNSAIAGYYAAALSLTRNLVEAIIHTKYILSDSRYIDRRAVNYFKSFNKETIISKAKFNLDSQLYEIYSFLCNFSHSNYLAVMQDYNDNVFYPHPTLDSPTAGKLNSIIGLINALFIYYAEFISEYYKYPELNFTQTPRTAEILSNLKIEKATVDLLFNAFGSSGVSESVIAEIKGKFAEYRAKPTKNHNKGKKKKKG